MFLHTLQRELNIDGAAPQMNCKNCYPSIDTVRQYRPTGHLDHQSRASARAQL